MYGKLLVLVVGGLILSACTPGLLPGQVTSDADIAARLRRMLLLPDSVDLDVTRDYAPSYFPGVTFYRASHRPRGSHVREHRVAVVVAGERIIEVDEPNDLASLWSLVVPSQSLPLDQEVAMWMELLIQAALMPRLTTIIYSVDELSAASRVFLEPEMALEDIAPPRRDGKGEESILVFFVRSPEGVAAVHVSKAEAGVRLVRISVIAVDTR